MEKLKIYFKALGWTLIFWLFSFAPIFIFMIVSEYAEKEIVYNYNTFAVQIIPACLPVVLMKITRNDTGKVTSFLLFVSVIFALTSAVYLVMRNLSFSNNVLDLLLTIPLYVLSFFYVFSDFKYDLVSKKESEYPLNNRASVLEKEAFK